MTVTVKLMRSEAEVLYYAAVSQMLTTGDRAHLWTAAINLRVDCGMHVCSENPYTDAVNQLKKDLGDS